MNNLQELIHRHKELRSQLDLERPNAAAAVREAVQLFGLSAEDCGFATPASPARRLSPPKYRFTDGQEWSGRGRAPVWARELIAAGQSLDKYLITKNAGQK